MESAALTNTPCDRGRCPAAALVLVEKKVRPVVDGGRDYTRDLVDLHLAFCGHDFNDLDVLLNLAGFRPVVDLRPKGLRK